MKEYKYKFISSVPLLVITLIMITFFTLEGIFFNVYFLLNRNFAFLIFIDVLIVSFFLFFLIVLCTVIELVKVYEDRITFKALWRKEKTLLISEIRNVYACPTRLGGIFILGTRIAGFRENKISYSLLTRIEGGYHPFEFAMNKLTMEVIQNCVKKEIILINKW